MAGNIYMNSNRITGLPEPILETEPATKKWVTADFPTKTQILDGFTMNGILDLGGHSIEGVTVPTNVDDAVTTKKYCIDSFLPKNTDFSIGSHEIETTSTTPSSDNILINRGYADTRYVQKTTSTPPASDTALINRGYADGRYVQKTKLTTFEWEWGYRNISQSYIYPHTRFGGGWNVLGTRAWRNKKEKKENNILT